ncbi:hypothetical protein LCY76_23445 [Fictibacillus sp. KIGAM418]|uniref:DUF5655 domain-containing protein n=1 Tax=Fictibacillus marinisediminis TaxID=2878389 RepID=A0A9X1XIG0_9BACL|nr:hypothetical protein [Fictibacillus marinisediminis]MCK6259530.1 hypothetical protein [Fictibacillus marinisediminis]
MKYENANEIFPLMKDEVTAKKAETIFHYIFDNFTDSKVVSLRSCISIAKQGDNHRKYATISVENGNSLLLHYPLELREKISINASKYKIKFSIPRRYGNQINIKLDDILSLDDLHELIEIAYKNPRMKKSAII